MRLDICSIRLFHMVFYTHHLFTLLISEVKLAYYQLHVFRNDEPQVLCCKFQNAGSYICRFFCYNHTNLCSGKGPLNKQICLKGNEIILYFLSDQPLCSLKLNIYKFALKMLKNINIKRNYDEKTYAQIANFLLSIAVRFGKESRMFTYTLKIICTEHWCLSISSSILLICVFSTVKGKSIDLWDLVGCIPGS